MAAISTKQIRRPASFKEKGIERGKMVDELKGTIATMSREQTESKLALAGLERYVDLGFSTTERALAVLGLSAATRTLPAPDGTIEVRRKIAEEKTKLMIATLALMTEELSAMDAGATEVAAVVHTANGGMSAAAWQDAQPDSLDRAIREVEAVFLADGEVESGGDDDDEAAAEYQTSGAGPSSFSRARPPPPSTESRSLVRAVVAGQTAEGVSPNGGPKSLAGLR